MASTSTIDGANRAGWSIPEFCAACNFSRGTFYNLTDELRPRQIKILKRTIVIEPPAQYLARLAAAQAERAR